MGKKWPAPKFHGPPEDPHVKKAAEEKYKLQGFKIPKRPDTPATTPAPAPPRPASPPVIRSTTGEPFNHGKNLQVSVLNSPMLPPTPSTNTPLIRNGTPTNLLPAKVFPHLVALGFPPPPICSNCQSYGHLAEKCEKGCGLCGLKAHTRMTCPGPRTDRDEFRGVYYDGPERSRFWVDPRLRD